ncbi:hypothetical protein ElyMa_006965900 [Elysia marginata]|uniref:Uncharacterized protein n=1 Tax=Elysia marginata TaxID=1093978 RepID=A0AAV4JKT8_9GAST|nr:hypothetical protein ElyMa_006965900 [Elysia marginata]
MRVITQDPEQSECAHQEPFIPACSDMERDNSEIPTSAVPTNTQVSVLECSAAPTPDTSIPTSPEPVSTQHGRKRRKNECSWKDVQRKKSLNLGESYTNRKGHVIERKKMKAECGPKCRMHCQQTIKKEQRETMFHLFWRTVSIDMRRLYVCHTVQVKDKV